MKYWTNTIFSSDCYGYDFKLYKDSALPKLTPGEAAMIAFVMLEENFGGPDVKFRFILKTSFP